MGKMKIPKPSVLKRHVSFYLRPLPVSPITSSPFLSVAQAAARNVLRSPLGQQGLADVVVQDLIDFDQHLNPVHTSYSRSRSHSPIRVLRFPMLRRSPRLAAQHDRSLTL